MKVKYIGADDDQVRWGSNDDPRGVLIEGQIYEVEKVEPHTWHTKYHINGKKYNSVCFEDVRTKEPAKVHGTCLSMCREA